jgi:hypothetical protein
VIDIFDRQGAGRSAERKFKRMARAWRVRVFGRRTPYYLSVVLILLIVFVASLHLQSSWALLAGFTLGMAVMAAGMIPDALLPGHIFNWQVGAWGEQMTARELTALPKESWTVQHDRKWGDRANHDHVVAGGAVFVLNSKNLKDSSITVNDGVVRLSRLDEPDDGYIAEWWVGSAKKEAASLKRELERRVGFPVHVYSVVVLWGEFEVGQEYVDGVSFVRGDALVDWLKSRPVDLLDEAKRERVAQWARSLPAA